MAWDLLIVMYRRCHMFLWPDGNVPTPIRWKTTVWAPCRYDRVLDERLFWRLEVLLDKVKLGVDWATGRDHSASGNPAGDDEPAPWDPFWRHVIQVLPRGAWVDEHDPQFIHYTLEGSL